MKLKKKKIRKLEIISESNFIRICGTNNFLQLSTMTISPQVDSYWKITNNDVILLNYRQAVCSSLKINVKKKLPSIRKFLEEKEKEKKKMEQKKV